MTCYPHRWWAERCRSPVLVLLFMSSHSSYFKDNIQMYFKKFCMLFGALRSSSSGNTTEICSLFPLFLLSGILLPVDKKFFGFSVWEMTLIRCEAISPLFCKTSANYVAEKENMDSLAFVICQCLKSVKKSQNFPLSWRSHLDETCLSPVGLWDLMFSESHFSSHWQCWKSNCFQGKDLVTNFQILHTFNFVFVWLQTKIQDFQNVSFQKILSGTKFLRF